MVPTGAFVVNSVRDKIAAKAVFLVALHPRVGGNVGYWYTMRGTLELFREGSSGDPDAVCPTTGRSSTAAR